MSTPISPSVYKDQLFRVFQEMAEMPFSAIITDYAITCTVCTRKKGYIHIYNKHVGVPRISPLKQLNIMGKKFQRHPCDILQEITKCLIFDHLPLSRIRY